MAPSAPGRFSTTTDWPRVCDIGTAMILPTTSSAPPAGKGATIRIGLDGYCASAAPAAHAARNPSSVLKACIDILLCNTEKCTPSPVQFALHVRSRLQAQAHRPAHARLDDDPVRHLGNRVLHPRRRRPRQRGHGERHRDHPARARRADGRAARAGAAGVRQPGRCRGTGYARGTARGARRADRAAAGAERSGATPSLHEQGRGDRRDRGRARVSGERAVLRSALFRLPGQPQHHRPALCRGAADAAASRAPGEYHRRRGDRPAQRFEPADRPRGAEARSLGGAHLRPAVPFADRRR